MHMRMHMFKPLRTASAVAFVIAPSADFTSTVDEVIQPGR
jgi:hypothetical protein